MTTTMITKSALLFGVGLGMLPGCPLLDVQADAQEVCLTYPNLQIPASTGLSSLKQTFVFDDLSSIHDLAKLDANLEFVRAEARATSGIASFAFVQAAHIVLSSGDPASTLPALTMYDCDGDCAPDGSRLDLPAALVNDAIAYLKTNSIVVDLDFEGQVPTVAWTMDVDVCVKARAGYTFSP
jgi:hypothetical protein